MEENNIKEQKLFEQTENGKNILCQIMLGGIIYYIDEDQTIYTKDEKGFHEVKNESIKSDIIDIICPKSMDNIR